MHRSGSLGHDLHRPQSGIMVIERPHGEPVSCPRRNSSPAGLTGVIVPLNPGNAHVLIVASAVSLSGQLPSSGSAALTLPTALSPHPAEETIRRRWVTTPDEAHKALLSRWGLTLPQRLHMVRATLFHPFKPRSVPGVDR